MGKIATLYDTKGEDQILRIDIKTLREAINTLNSKPTVTGSLGGNAALESLVEALESIGLITNDTSA